MRKTLIAVVIILSISFSGCSLCSVRHAGDKPVICINGHVHQVCDYKPPVVAVVHKGFFEQLSELVLRIRSKEVYDIITKGEHP